MNLATVVSGSVYRYYASTMPKEGKLTGSEVRWDKVDWICIAYPVYASVADLKG